MKFIVSVKAVSKYGVILPYTDIATFNDYAMAYEYAESLFRNRPIYASVRVSRLVDETLDTWPQPTNPELP